MTDWESAISAIQAKPSRRRLFRRIAAERSFDRRALGQSLKDVASVYGRPTWYIGEPATGGLTVGWKRYPYNAVRFSQYNSCTYVLSRAPMETELSWRVRILNNMNERAATEIIKWLGLPNARTLQNGCTILQWQRPGYHIALQFGPDDRCSGIHEWTAKPLRV
jgi:hypothetical protein